MFDYKIKKTGFPFYTYSVIPEPESDNTCLSMAAILENHEMYGPYGNMLNFILYSTLFFAAIMLHKKMKVFHAHNRH
jgi:hypothetical protein